MLQTWGQLSIGSTYVGILIIWFVIDLRHPVDELVEESPNVDGVAVEGLTDDLVVRSRERKRISIVRLRLPRPPPTSHLLAAVVGDEAHVPQLQRLVDPPAAEDGAAPGHAFNRVVLVQEQHHLGEYIM